MKKFLLAALIACFAIITQAQTRPAIIHLKDGKSAEFDIAQIDSITFGKAVTYDKTLQATYAQGVYFGSGMYLTAISDQEMNNGLPMTDGQVVVWFYAVGDESADATHAILPPGRYPAIDRVIPYGILKDTKYLKAMIGKGTKTADGRDSVGIETIAFDIDATVNVDWQTNGTYLIDFKGQTSQSAQAGFSNLNLIYQGNFEYINQDPAYYEKLDKDVTMMPNGGSGGYSLASDGTYGTYNFAFFNAPVDAQGFISGAGELINLMVLTQPTTNVDVTKLPGTYTVGDIMSDDAWKPGRFLSGIHLESYGSYFSFGTYYTTYDADGQQTSLRGYVTGGTVTISLNDAKDQVHFVLDLVVDGGHKVKMEYTIPASSIYKTQ